MLSEAFEGNDDSIYGHDEQDNFGELQNTLPNFLKLDVVADCIVGLFVS